MKSSLDDCIASVAEEYTVKVDFTLQEIVIASFIAGQPLDLNSLNHKVCLSRHLKIHLLHESSD